MNDFCVSAVKTARNDVHKEQHYDVDVAGLFNIHGFSTCGMCSTRICKSTVAADADCSGVIEIVRDIACNSTFGEWLSFFYHSVGWGVNLYLSEWFPHLQQLRT